MSGMSERPRNLVERAADAAFDAVDAVLEQVGAEVDTLYIALVAEGVPAGELDAVTAAHGKLPEDLSERARHVVAFLVTEAASTAKTLGLDVRIVPLPGAPGHG